MAHQELTKAIKIDQAIDPKSVAGVLTSLYYDMSKATRALIVILQGAWTSDQTVQIRQATNVSGGSVKDITGKLVTMLTGTANSKHVIEVDASELDVEGGFTHISVTTGSPAGGTNIMAAVIIREPKVFPPDYITT